MCVLIWRSFTSTLPQSTLNIWKCQSNWSHNHSFMSMTFDAKPIIRHVRTTNGWHLGQPTSKEHTKNWKNVYYRVSHIPGLLTHHFQPIQFTLVVDEFCIEYVIKWDAENLQDQHKVDIDWTSKLYCGTALNWYYKNRCVDVSMPRCIKKQFQQYVHIQTGPHWFSSCPAHAQLMPRSMAKLTNILSQN